MSEEIKNCPACNKKPKIEEIGNDFTKKRTVVIQCSKCRTKLTNSAIRYDMEWLINSSIKSWNDQPRIDELEAKVKALEGKLSMINQLTVFYKAANKKWAEKNLINDIKENKKD